MEDIRELVKGERIRVTYQWVERGLNIEADAIGNKARETKEDVIAWAGYNTERVHALQEVAVYPATCLRC